jgi:hypothetical protein
LRDEKTTAMLAGVRVAARVHPQAANASAMEAGYAAYRDYYHF